MNWGNINVNGIENHQTYLGRLDPHYSGIKLSIFPSPPIRLPTQHLPLLTYKTTEAWPLGNDREALCKTGMEAVTFILTGGIVLWAGLSPLGAPVKFTNPGLLTQTHARNQAERRTAATSGSRCRRPIISESVGFLCFGCRWQMKPLCVD